MAAVVGRPEALLVVPVTPAAAGNGLAMRAGILLEGLALTHDVHVMVVPVFGGARPPDELTSRLAASVSVHVLPSPVDAMVSRLSSAPDRARATRLHPVPGPSAQLDMKVAQTVAGLAAQAAVVVVMRLYLAPVLDALLQAADRPPVLVDLDDLDWERENRLGQHAEAAAYERLAAEYLPLVDGVITASTRDQALATSLGAAAVVVPNGVRPPTPVVEAEPRYDLLLVGNLSYAPNAEGAAWLCRDVLPRLGGVTVAVVGSGPPPAVAALAGDARVTVAGDVADVTPWYAAARVATAPVHAGGGTRIKILEAWAHCRPVVSTSLGAEGLDMARAGLIGDDPGSFAGACSRLLESPALAASMAATGRQRVLEGATAAHAAALLAELVTSMVRP